MYLSKGFGHVMVVQFERIDYGMTYMWKVTKYLYFDIKYKKTFF